MRHHLAHIPKLVVICWGTGMCRVLINGFWHCVCQSLCLQGQHERAVEYFRRALRLSRTYLSAWTLMGHEYVEMKNAPAAIGEAVRGWQQQHFYSVCGTTKDTTL